MGYQVQKLSSNLKTKYGTFDCFHNALICLLHKEKRQISKLIKYNWSIESIGRHKIFTGGVYPDILLEFSSNNLGFSMTRFPIEDITNLHNRWAIIPIDIYDLPYLKKYYHQVHQIHFVAVNIYGNTAKVYDHNFDAMMDMPIKEVIQSWSFFKEQSYLLKSSMIPLDSKEEILPYLANQDFQKKYKETFNNFLKVSNEILDQPESRLLNKCYGSIISIIQNRKLHFNQSPSKYEDNVIKYWNITQKELIRFTTKSTLSNTLLESALNNTFESEMEYLSRLKQSTIY